jgi:hypothetical protein
MAEDYIVRGGDSMMSIAFDHGVFYETLWNHSANAALKQKRKNPNVLMPGDVVHVPDKVIKEVSAAQKKRHKFKLKGVPAKLNLRILEESEPNASGGSQEDMPRKNVPFNLYVDEVLLTEGNTDADGWVKCAVAPNARTGRLVLEPGTDKETSLVLSFGHLNPIEEVSGVQGRLRNLGFDCGEEEGDLGPQTEAAIQAFQAKNGLQASGELDSATRDKLRQLHDGN